MTELTEQDAHRAAQASREQALLAPSVHDTQPWRMVVRPDVLEIYADRDRQLAALDVTGRQVLVSCGCALLNARVVLAEAEHRIGHRPVPDPTQPDLVARVTLFDGGGPWTPLANTSANWVDVERTAANSYPEEVPPEVVYEMANAAARRRTPTCSASPPMSSAGSLLSCVSRRSGNSGRAQATGPSCAGGRPMISPATTEYPPWPCRHVDAGSGGEMPDPRLRHPR